MKLFFTHPFLAWELKKLARENQGKPLNIMDDAVFKSMLAADNEDSRIALRSLLSACTRRTVSEVQVLNSELIPVHRNAKVSLLDVHVTFNDGETANLEMQTSKSNDDLCKRAEYYTAVILAGRLPKGKMYKDIKRVYQIFFLNFILFPQSDKFSRRYYYQEAEDHERLSNTTEIIFYELPKLEQRFRDFQAGMAGMENLTEEEKWCIYIKYRHENFELIEHICQKEEGIMHAEKAVKRVSRDLRMYARRVAEMKYTIDSSISYSTGKAEGREEGIQEGLTEGLEKGKLQIARNLLDKGSTPEFVQEITGLDMKTIQELSI